MVIEINVIVRIAHNYEIFKTDIPVIVDDTNRENDKDMSIFLRKKLNKKTTVSIGCGDKIFTILF